MTTYLFCLLLTTLASEPMVGRTVGQTFVVTNIAAYTTSADAPSGAAGQGGRTLNSQSIAPLQLETSAKWDGGFWLIGYFLATVQVEGGCAPYTYQWQPGPYVFPDSGLTGSQARFLVGQGTDSYATVTVTDFHGATSTASVRLRYGRPSW